MHAYAKLNNIRNRRTSGAWHARSCASSCVRECCDTCLDKATATASESVAGCVDTHGSAHSSTSCTSWYQHKQQQVPSFRIAAPLHGCTCCQQQAVGTVNVMFVCIDNAAHQSRLWSQGFGPTVDHEPCLAFTFWKNPAFTVA